MGKTYTVALPLASERVLKYTRVEREEFEKRFRHFGLPGMKEILFEKVFPVRPDPNNDNKPSPTGGGDSEAQRVLVWMGIRHNNPAIITEQKVSEWLDLAAEEGRPTLAIIAECINAVLASRILGFKWEAPEEAEEGKVQPAEATP